MANPYIKLEHPPITEHAPRVFNRTPQATPSNTGTSSMASTPTPSGRADVDDQQLDVVDDQQLDVLGRPVQKLVKLIRELEGLGIEKTDLPLPKIIVVGDQSTGKSSLIEGLSGIKVPRSQGTCTRCPLEITLLSSAEQDTAWSCEVKLGQQFSYHPDASLDGRYGKWHRDHRLRDSPFTTVTDKTELEEVIARAQRATLNPDDDPMKYLNAASINEMPMQVEFSPNKVVLRITASGQPSLSFLDLPGVVKSMEKPESKWFVGLVENFVTDHIKQDNSLILLARPIDNDLANSGGAALIEECEGALARTVGCLTKPDRLPPSNSTQLLQKVLRGNSFAVGHGYFVTKQPNQVELEANISADEARSSEDGFFAQAPWATELQEFQDRFGTFKLRDFLSVKLTDQIRVTLPSISRTVNARLEQIELELGGYPDPPENALGKVLEALTGFRIAVEKHTQGVHPYNTLRNTLNDLADTFRSNLYKLRPTLNITTPSIYRQPIEPPVFTVPSDDEDGSPCAPQPKQNKKRKAEFNTPTTPSTAKKIKSDIPVRESLASTTGRKVFRLLEMRDTLSKLSASGVPGEVDSLAINHLRKETFVGWESPMLEFLESSHKAVHSTMEELLEKACAQWLNTAFFSEAQKIVKAFVANVMDEQHQQAHRDLGMEQYMPLTLNTDAYKLYHDRELQKLEDGRAAQRLLEKSEDADRAAGKFSTPAERKKDAAKATGKAKADLGDDPFAEEIKVMAKVKGYHDVALHRFLDRLHRGIQIEVLRELETKLLQQLMVGLEVETNDAQDRCKELLAEDREREIRRKELQTERANFIEAQHKLAAIGQTG